MSFSPRPACLWRLILLTFLIIPHAKAEDDADAVIVSSLRAIPAGSVKVAAAAMTLQHGVVDLTITTRASDAAAIIDVEGPPFKWLGDQDTYPDRQFPELQISIDHKPAASHDHSTATFANTNITDELKAAGIDLFTISQSPPVLFPTTTNQQIFNRLIAMGAIAPLGGQDVAAWTAQRAIAFSLPKGAHFITLNYNARPAITLQPIADLAKLLPLATYCLTAQALNIAAAHAARSGYVLAAQYAIPVNVDGDAGPTVSIDLADPGSATLPASIAFFCAPNGKPFTATNATIHAVAKPDASGIIHILTLGSH